jgi:hypothetical protein
VNKNISQLRLTKDVDTKQVKGFALMTSNCRHGRYPREHGRKIKIVANTEGEYVSNFYHT